MSTIFIVNYVFGLGRSSSQCTSFRGHRPDRCKPGTRRFMGILATILLWMFAFFTQHTAYAQDAAAIAFTINSWSSGGTGTLTAIASDTEVTVTGEVIDATNSLQIVINNGVLVNWQASLIGTTSNIALSGDGEFRYTSGIIEHSGTSFAIWSNGNNLITINGGEIIGGIRIAGNGEITVNDGTVTGTDKQAIYATGSGNKLYISGGIVTNNDNSVIYFDNRDNTELNVEVSGTGKVLKTGTVSGTGIYTYGSVEVKGDAEVITVNGYAIRALGSGSKVSVNGGTVSAEDDVAIYVDGSNSNVSVSGGMVSATNSYAIQARGSGSTVNVSGGEVTTNALVSVIYIENEDNTKLNVEISGTGKVRQTGTGRGITTYGSVDVKGNDAEITATSGYAINILGSGVVTVSSGTVSVTSGRGIYAEGSDSKAIVSGGTVRATTGRGIWAEGSDSKVIILNNGIVSCSEGGYAISLVGSNTVAFNDGGMVISASVNLSGNNSLYIEKTGTNNSYNIGTNNELTVLPDGASARWDIVNNKSGISYTRNINNGFLEVTGITVLAATYRVTFNYNDEVTETEVVEVVESKYINQPSDPNRDGYEFEGWFEEDSTEAFDFDAPVTGNITLYAKWEKLTGTGEIFAPNLNVYPNPFVDMLRIEGAEGCILHVINGNGSIVHFQKIENADQTIHLDHLPNGIYIFRIEKDHLMKILKVVKI